MKTRTDMMREWAIANGLEEIWNQYEEACDEIAAECEAEGYPSHGSNYELRVERLRESYPELFGDDDEEDEAEDEQEEGDIIIPEVMDNCEFFDWIQDRAGDYPNDDDLAAMLVSCPSWDYLIPWEEDITRKLGNGSWKDLAEEVARSYAEVINNLFREFQAEQEEDEVVTFGNPTFECLEDNAGGIHLFVMDDDGQPQVVFSGFEYQPAGSLLSALKELQEDRHAWACWDNAETEDVEEFYVRLTEYSDPIATLDDHGYIDIYESECYVDSRKQLGVPEGIGHVVVGSHDWDLIQSGKMIKVMAVEAACNVGRVEAIKKLDKGAVEAYTDLEEHAEAYASEWYADDEEEKAAFLEMVRSGEPANDWEHETIDGKSVWLQILC